MTQNLKPQNGITEIPPINLSFGQSFPFLFKMFFTYMSDYQTDIVKCKTLMTRILTTFKNDENLCLPKKMTQTSDNSKNIIFLHLKPEKLDEHSCIKFDMCPPPPRPFAY